MTSYDELPYPSYAFPQTHPDRLAMLATLLGLEPASVAHCRVLEIGCAAGGNLIPLGFAFPGSTFVGIDLSARQIAAGQATVAELGLTNVQLHHQDLCTLGHAIGTFDYIIAHGVYSWVPAPVRDALLCLVKRHLAPHGVAYISYNTNPGWHKYTALREMLRFHTRRANSPTAALDLAFDLLGRFATLAADPQVPPSPLLDLCRTYLKQLEETNTLNGRACTYHDILAEINDPCLFAEFVAHTSSHGLQYLAEADFATVLPANLAPPVAHELATLAGSLVEMEQAMDFVRGRSFRRTLLVHDTVRVERALRPDRLLSLQIASSAVPVSTAPSLAADVSEQFRAPTGAIVSLDTPLGKAALICLARAWPASLPFAQLFNQACTLLGPAAPAGEDRAVAAAQLAADLLSGFCSDAGLVELHTAGWPAAATLKARPVASVVARHQAAHGTIVTNMRHESVALNELQRALLPYLDGTHDHEALRAVLRQLVAAGRLVLEGIDAAQSPDANITPRLEQGLAELLASFAHSSLLVNATEAK